MLWRTEDRKPAGNGNATAKREEIDMRMVFVDGPITEAEPAEAPATRVLMSERLIRWIEHFCRVPGGVLTDEQKAAIRTIYDGPAVQHVVHGELGTFLALASLCGPIQGENRVSFAAASNQQMWDAASPELQGILYRNEQGRIFFTGRAVLTT
jgi:hypothetical protein